MTEHIKFIDASSFETIERASEVMKYIHIINNCSGEQDHTICGINIDGNRLGKVKIPFIVTDEKITCPYCIDLINFCKSINLNEIKKTKNVKIENSQNFDFNKLGLDTSVKYALNDEAILVGDIVSFKFSNYFGVVKGIICFEDGVFGAKVITKESKTFNTFVPISVSWEKIK